MKARRYQATEERMLLTALIVHDGVLGRLYRHFGGEFDRPFRSKWSNLIAGWCFRFFSKYGRAPKQHIQDLFDGYAQSSKDEEAVGLIEKFLSSLDADYRMLAKGINEDLVIDKASNFFNKVRLERTVEMVQAHLESNEVDEAHKVYAEFEKINLASNEWSGFDPAKIKQALRKRDQDERLVEWSGELDVFLSPYFKRDAFIAFAGPDKRGKSYWLQEVVWRALKQRRKVLYYVLGDMSEPEVFQRLCVRMTGHPLVRGLVRIPKRLIVRAKGAFSVKADVQKRRAMALADIGKARKRLLTATGSKEVKIKIRCEGGSIISAGDIEKDVERFTKEGFIPDVIVVDYADLLAPEPHTRHLDYRHQSNTTWMILRRVAMKSHCLVVVATQTAATAYGAWVIKKKDFSEDKRKNAHVTGMIGINQTDKEKESGVYRLNWIVLRGGKWAETQCVWTAGDLSIASPCITSAFMSKDSEEED